MGHSSLLLRLPRGQLGTDSLSHRPIATDAIALKSRFLSPLTSCRKNENGKRSDILFSFLLLVLGNRTEATYDWNEMRFFLANKHSTCRISTHLGLQSVLKTLNGHSCLPIREGLGKGGECKWLIFRELAFLFLFLKIAFKFVEALQIYNFVRTDRSII